MFSTQVIYMDKFSSVGEKVSPYQNRRTAIIADWEFGLFSGVDVDTVDALGRRKDAAELGALRNRLDSFGANVIKVKCELKSLRESLNQLRRNVESSQNKMMEELHRFMTLINEKYREGGDIQIDCEQTKKTRSEILQTETQGDLLENRPKNVVPSKLAKDLDCPVLAEDIAKNNADENTDSDRRIDEGHDMGGCNQICTERDVNDEEVAQRVQFDRPPRRSAKNRPLPIRIIKGLISARMPRKEAGKDFRKSVVNVTMIDLRRLPNVVKSKILQNLWDLKKDPGKSVVKMVLHDCNRKQMYSLKLREWVDGEVDSTDGHSYVFKLFMSDIVRGNILRELDSIIKFRIGDRVEVEGHDEGLQGSYFFSMLIYIIERDR
ncbi:hypothetical protein M9H77_14332 [Catharanthus roseus]|uniref:Uncharacterized protein n=1 Tax=Catharanthus roseus TaxID=4058 RepID=A0ACC0BMX9_CATRO|nr:hypothetical protein M9H77_14332 [Catharanthus roseus]